METKVRYLVDTNVWLERLLDQEKSEITSNFFDSVSTEQILISDFSLHSICVILFRFKKLDILKKFLTDLFLNGQIEQVNLNTIDLFDVITNSTNFKLDFDDSYQLTLSQKFDLTIVTFDSDFNVEGIKKKSPEEVVENK